MLSIIDYFEEKVGLFPDNPLVWEKTNGQIEPTSYKEIHELDRKYAAGFMALG